MTESVVKETFVKCGTTKGPFVLHLKRQWSPQGYDRAVELFQSGFMDNSHFYRVVPKFLVQFGLTYDSKLRRFHRITIPDDPQLDPPISFDRGTLSFAGSGPNSRTSQLFISYGKIKSLGTQLWETPVGEVIEGMENIESLYAEYGDMPPWGNGPEQHMIQQTDGLEYMEQHFGEMDRFTTCIVSPLLPKTVNEIQDGGLQTPALIGGILLCITLLAVLMRLVAKAEARGTTKVS